MPRTIAAHSSSSSRVVANSRPSGSAPTQWPERPMRCSATAIERGAELHDQVDRTDVDPELERSGRDDGAQLAVLELVLGIEPQLFGQAAVMRHHDAFAQPLLQREGDALAHPARADEHERRPMCADQLGQPVVDLARHLVAGDAAQLVGRNLYRQLHRATVPDIDDLRLGAEEPRDGRDGPNRRRQPDALRLTPALALHERIEARQGQREVRAALIGRNGVNLIDDDRLHAREEPARLFGRHQDEQRLGRRDENVRRFAQHPRAVALRGITGARRGANRRELDPATFGEREQLAERRLEILADVVGQGFERRDVDRQRLIGQRSVGGLANQIVQAQGEGRERLTRARRCRDQHVLAGANQRPALDLRLGRLAVPVGKPIGDERMKGAQHGRRLQPAHRTSVCADRRAPAARRRTTAP